MGKTLFSKTRSALLALLYGHPDESFHLRQLLRAIGVGHGALQRELKTLTEMGILLRTNRGNQVVYQANANSPIFPELRSLVTKTFGVHDAIRTALSPLAAKIEIAFMYGSVAEQRERAASDIDLMILGGVSFAEVVAALASAQREIRREINPTVYPVSEFRKKLAAGNHFLKSLIRQKNMFIVGTQRELTKLAAK